MDGAGGSDSRDRQHLWLPLLRELTRSTESWLVWKNADAALTTGGDVDSAAVVSELDQIKATFLAWSGSHGFPTVFCNHYPGAFLSIALDEPDRRVLELHVTNRQTYRGSSLFEAEELRSFAALDPRGFRRVEPALEGLLLLALNGLRFPARRDDTGLSRKGIASLLQGDLDLETPASVLFGPAGRPLTRLARAVASGGWSTPAAVELELIRLGKTAAHPISNLRRVRKRDAVLQKCPVLRMTAGGRRLPTDLDTWLLEVRKDHEVRA